MDSLSTLLAASGNRWTRNPKTRIIRKLIDNSGNQISLIWVPSHAGISGNKAAKDALTEEIDKRETYPPHYLIKWMKKKEAMNRQQR
jgi:ribonuclease HI